MNGDEERAREYLLSLGRGEVVFEPDGNCAPDFSIDRRTAVEVRRLNQSVGTDNDRKGLETDQIALNDLMRGLLLSLGGPTNGLTWFVTYRFRRPIPSFREIERAVRAYLRCFPENGSPQRYVKIAKNFWLSAIPAERAWDKAFVLGGFTDGDTFGWLIPMLTKNIQQCVNEKTNKIRSVHGKYLEWWLVLVDRINYGRRENVEISHSFDKLVLISPRCPTRAYEITSV